MNGDLALSLLEESHLQNLLELLGGQCMWETTMVNISSYFFHGW